MILNYKIPKFLFSSDPFQPHNFFTLPISACVLLAIAISREWVVVAILVRKQGPLKIEFEGYLIS